MAKRILLATVLVATAASAAPPPPVPAQAHPRLFMRPADITAYGNAAKLTASASHQLIDKCQRTIDMPQEFAERGGADGDYWANATIACAFAFRVTGQKPFLAQAMKYWRVSLNDDQKVGDGLGCTTEQASSNWRTSWNGEAPAPHALLTVSHDTWYPIRWFGPAVALAYDWLYDQADEPLRAQSRTCLTGWLDAYTKYGYMREDPGSNYHAGFVIAKTLAAIAIGKDGGADGHLWTETVRDLFAKQLVGMGLAGSSGGLDKRAGLLVGGDWGSWQYAPLSVLELAVAARALDEHGAPQPEMKDWLRAVSIRSMHGTLPQGDVQFTGNGDYEGEAPYEIYPELSANQLDAVLAGLSPDDAAAWAMAARPERKLVEPRFYNALAEIRAIAPKDYRAQTPASPLWLVARGVGNMYVRTSWGTDALWAVFMSGTPKADHAHLAASNFVLSRGSDHLIVDSSNYGQFGALGTNAVSADSGAPEEYALTQGPWGLPSLPWARGTTDHVYAARSDFARAFEFNGGASPINLARRDWVMFPEGEIVTIDRVQVDKGKNMYLNFHANTGGSLALDPTGVAVGDVGGSRLAIHRVRLSAGTPKVTHTPKSECDGNCNYPCGRCVAARYPVDVYSVAVPGPSSLAVHAFDALAKGEAPAKVDSVNDPAIDASHQNAAIVGAAILRAGHRSYAIGAAAAPSDRLTYGVPGDTASRHVVFDAPDARDGTSKVTAQAQAGRCTITIERGTGGGIIARPLIFDLASAADGCKLTPATDAAAAIPLPASKSDKVIEDVPPPHAHHGKRWWAKRLALAGVAAVVVLVAVANIARARRSRVRAS